MSDKLYQVNTTNFTIEVYEILKEEGEVIILNKDKGQMVYTKERAIIEGMRPSVYSALQHVQEDRERTRDKANEDLQRLQWLREDLNHE